MSLDYDLSPVDVPVSAQAAPPGARVAPFEVRAKDVLWVHGLFGRRMPDVGSLLAEHARGAEAVAELRVRHGASFHDWLVTHLSLTLVRMKTVTIRGVLVLEE